jgi:DNA-binding NarL/FixJ family response regulator
MRRDDVERNAGLRPAGVGGAQIMVLAEHQLIGQGLVDLLPEGWQDSAMIVDGIDALAQARRGAVGAVVIDAALPHAVRAAALTRAIGGAVIVLLPSPATPIDEQLYEDADAILLRDEVEPRTLRLALAAGRLGMRLLPRSLPAPASAAVPAAALAAARLPARGEPATRALQLLAEGLRDAEIALELSLSESAVRKLIQRAVKRSGARTRCQAVAAAVQSGGLG